MASTSLNDIYETGTGENIISVKVTVPGNQRSVSTVKLNAKVILENFVNTFSIDLGKAKDITGSKLFIETTEADIDPDTNTVSFELEIQGGSKVFSDKRTQTVSTGGNIYYTAEIVLIP